MSTTATARHDQSLASRLNWLRAGVLGANDGIVSTASLVFGVAGATSDSVALFIAGVAGMVAGALSMGAGEYVSVSSQRDTEQAALIRVRSQLHSDPGAKRNELIAHYALAGLSDDLARDVADELTEHDGVAAHARTLLRIDAEDHTNPWHAALASTSAFTLGALIPLLAIVFSPMPIRLAVTLLAVMSALAMTGYTSSRLSGSQPLRPIVRNLVAGTIAMALAYAAGTLVGAYL